MANGNQGKPRPVEAVNPDDRNKKIDKRQVKNFLPAVLQTNLTEKFFAGTGDHLFQPEISERLVGFLGRVPAHVNFEQDFYIDEPTKQRRDHQLESTMISSNPDTGDTTNIMFYDDIVNLLRFQGGIVDNEDKLFETEYYSWSPCIDLDKLMNFTNYFWFPGGPDTIRITELTDVGNQIGSTNSIIIQGIELQDGDLIILTNDLDISFNNRLFQVQGIGVSFNLVLETELFQFLWDDSAIAWDNGPWDGQDPQIAISFDDPDYIVMQRGAKDGNPWSVGNRWYHRDELNQTQLAVALENQAKRPIIEFCRDLELFNYGTFGRSPVTVRDDVTTDPDLSIVGLSSVTIDGIRLSNGDTILFTNSPTLQGTWDIEPWDEENTPDGIWDQFFNINYSSTPNDITLSSNTIITSSGDFVASGFSVGMRIRLIGSPNQDGIYTITSVTSTTITISGTFAPPIGSPIPNNVTIIEEKTQFQNRIFRIDGLGTINGATLTIVTDGQNPDGSPADGDKIKILLGLTYQGKEFFFDGNQNSWIESQQKITINQTPLFQLYDTEAIKLNDPGKYPNNTFLGSKIFGYDINEDPRQPIDSILGFPLRFDSFGEIIFENYLVTERYKFNIPKEEILGYYFHRTLNEISDNDEFSNDWYLSKVRTRQFLLDQFVTDDDTKNFKLAVTPASDNLNEVQVFVNGVEKTDRRWDFVDNEIQFFDFFNNDDLIQIRYFSTEVPSSNSNATYEIPANLEANPDNDEITFASKTDFFEHFSSIMENQVGFEGNAIGSNNWRDTLQDRSLGDKILQHRAPMLKLMALGSNRNIDFMLSVRFVEREFSRFRGKILRKINEFFNDGIHNDTQPPSEWVEDALNSINLGKTIDFPFANSGMGIRTNGQPTFIPSSPSRLGIFPVYQPEKYTDLTLKNPKDVLQLHDGSIMVAFGDFRDDVLLELEQNIFDAIPDEYKTQELPDFDINDFIEGQFRDGDYSLEEFNKLLTPIIQRWATQKGLDLTKNEDHSPTDPFTFNYSKQGLPGYWRGIFKKFYDTDRPNTHPWEMFGFGSKPIWWDNRYGPRPYKSTNTFLWDDMRAGRIALGPRAGINPKYARPGAPTPVDVNGNILDPITLGIAVLPGLIDARAPWKIGDNAPVENIFRRSEFWSFAISQISYLMKPARFIELGWDPKLGRFRYNNGNNPQWIHTDTEDRKRHSEFNIHNEILDDGTTVTSNGITQWISDWITSNGQNPSIVFGDVIRTLEVKLGHKMAGFINANATRALADNFGLVPQEDINVNLYRNPSIREEVYSGVIIERVDGGWAVHGYDVLNPFFNIVPPQKGSRQIPIDVNTIRVSESTKFKDDKIEKIPYGTVFRNQQQIYDFLISYQRFLTTQGWIFNEFDSDVNAVQNWRLAGKQFLFWSIGNWATGSIIALSPAANKVKFSTEQGTIQNVEQIINGVYSLLDRDGKIIQPEETFVNRHGNELIITPDETRAIYSVRLFVAELEHVITFSNKTIFNDLIYDPLFRLRQPRFKFFTTRAGGWKGRLDAPGFMVTDDGLIPNFEKTTNDFRRYFEIEDVVERPSLQDTARRVVGFVARDYLEDLLLSDTTQFQFYQGFIRKKGTRLTLDRLLRSDSTTDAEELQIFEEWAFRLGEFGSVQDSTTIEVILKEQELKGNPQLIEFRGSKLANGITDTTNVLSLINGKDFPQSGVIRIDDEIIFYTNKFDNILSGLSRGQRQTVATSHESNSEVGLVDNINDDVITIAPDDNRWRIRPPNDGLVEFPFRNLNNIKFKRSRNAAYLLMTDVALAGYPLETEVTHRVNTIDERDSLFNDLLIDDAQDNLQFGDLVWVDNIGDFYTRHDEDNPFDDDPRAIFNFGFMVYRLTDTLLDFEIASLPVGDFSSSLSTIVTVGPHYLQNDNFITLTGATGFNPDIIGSYKVQNATITLTGDGTTRLFQMPNLVNLDPDNTEVTINDIAVTNFTIVGGIETIVSSVGSPPFEYNVGDSIIINDVEVVLNTTVLPTVSTIISGLIGATTTAGNIILIGNGIGSPTEVTLNGTTIDDAVLDINSFNITNITAKKVGNALILINSAGGEISIDDINGSPVNDLFGLGSFFTTPLPLAGVDSAVIDINNAAITGISATNQNGKLIITESNGNSIELASGIGTALTDLGFTAGIFQSLGNAILFDQIDPAPINGSKIVVKRINRFDIDITFNTIGDTSDASIGMWAEARYFGEENPNSGDRNDIIYRNNFKMPQGHIIDWNVGELSFVDFSSQPELIDGISPWTVYEYDPILPSPFWKIAKFDNVDRIQSRRIDTTLFKQSLLFNQETNITDIKMNIWDPAKGLFPAQTIREIDFKLEFDPAKYSNGDPNLFQIDPEFSWDDRQVGMVWWDLSVVEYEQYETGSNRERRNKWGRIAPGKSIDIYEWIRSPVPPTEWAELVEANANQPMSSFRYKPSGEAFKTTEVDEPPFSKRTIINSATGKNIIEYYFWVKNSETIPNIRNRNLSVAQIARQMTNPTSAGIQWWAPINRTAIIVSGIAQFLTDEDTVMQINFNFTRTDVNFHREWVLGREGDPSDTPKDRFWNKMVDSLVGFNKNNKAVPDPNLELSRQLGNFIRPRQSWFKNREQAIEVFFNCLNKLFIQECIIDTRGIEVLNGLFATATEPTLFIPTGGPTDYGSLSGPITGFADYGFVSDLLISNSVDYGFVNESISFDNVRTSCEYDFHVTDLEARNLLTTQSVIDSNNNVVGPMSIGQQVWVDGVNETLGFWTVWKLNGFNNGQPVFIETCREPFKITDFWKFADFADDNFTIDTIVDFIVDTITERDALLNLDDGILVRVNDANNDGTNKNAIFEFDSTQFNPWILRFKEECTIQFNIQNFFDTSIGSADLTTISSDFPEGISGRDQALKAILIALRDSILTNLEENLLFFKMIKYVHTEQLIIDWVFKTTFIKVVGLNKSAEQSPILRPDTTNSLIKFIEEAKPFHTKLRDFVVNQDFGIDIYDANVIDFDKPVYFDDTVDDFRVLDPTNSDDIEILNDPNNIQNNWFVNFQSNPNLIRQNNIILLFDRVSCDIGGGWDPSFGWDVGPNEDWDLGLDAVDEHAAERILKYYLPQPHNAEDIEKNQVDPFKNIQETKTIASLISGCNFKGTIVDGGTMIIDINDIDTFLDGGPLANPGAPVNPEDIIVDGNLFIQPNFESDHPEELTLSSVGESLSVCVNTVEAISVDGTPSATYVNGQDIIINGTTVTLITGTTVDDAVVDINAANITDISAVNVDDALRLLSTNSITLAEGSGTALADLGFSVGVFSTVTAPNIAFRQLLDNVKAKEANSIRPLISTTLVTNIGSTSTQIQVAKGFGFPEDRAVIITNGIDNSFSITTVSLASDFLLVTLDGVIQIEGIDYIIASNTQIDFITTPTLNSELIISDGVDILILTDIGGKLDVESIHYSRVDILSNSLIIKDQGGISGRGINDTVASAHPVGSRVLILDPAQPQIADFDTFRVSDAGKTTLAQTLNLDDTTIELSSVAGLPKQTSSQQFMTKPGVIWIQGQTTISGEIYKFSERIEYFRRDGTTLKHIRRGTGGTTIGIPAIYDINGQLVDDYRTLSNVEYPAGSVVFDLNDKQRIPGNYEWESSESGLQFSDSLKAKFLRSSPGSC